MQVRFTVKGRIPSKKNGQEIRTRGSKKWIAPNKEHERWVEQAGLQLMAQGVPRKKIRCERTEIHFFFPDLRRADLYNKAESIADLMVDMSIIEDDNWFCTGDVILIGSLDRENPRAEITLTVKAEKC